MLELVSKSENSTMSSSSFGWFSAVCFFQRKGLQLAKGCKSLTASNNLFETCFTVHPKSPSWLPHFCLLFGPKFAYCSALVFFYNREMFKWSIPQSYNCMDPAIPLRCKFSEFPIAKGQIFPGNGSNSAQNWTDISWVFLQKQWPRLKNSNATS